MKSILMTLFLIASCSLTNELFGQTYTTESKSCGSCGGSVSINSRVGMTCPHCGVRWGHENESKSTRYSSNNYSNYDLSNSSGSTTSNANLRSSPSKNGSILKVIPIFSTVFIKYSEGSWYYVEYEYYDDYFNKRKINGYLHKSVLN